MNRRASLFRSRLVAEVATQTSSMSSVSRAARLPGIDPFQDETRPPHRLMKFSTTLPRLRPRRSNAIFRGASILGLLALALSLDARADEEARRRPPEGTRSRAQAPAAPLTPDRRARYLHIAGDILEAGGFLRDSRELHVRAEELEGDAAAQPERGLPERHEEPRSRDNHEAEVDERLNDLRRGVEAEMRELHEKVDRSFGEFREQAERELIGVHKKTDAEIGELHQRVGELHKLLAHIARDLEEDHDEDDDDELDEADEAQSHGENRERPSKKRRVKGPKR